MLHGSVWPKDFKTGLTIEMDGEPVRILEFSHSKQARGVASTNVKFKNLLSGGTLVRTVKASESFDPATISKVKAQYTYADGDAFYFMDNGSFESIGVGGKTVGEYKDWLSEGMDVELVTYAGVGGDEVIDILMPGKWTMKVVDTAPTLAGGDHKMKPGTLETGATVQLPAFVESGDMVVVDCDKRMYISRVL